MGTVRATAHYLLSKGNWLTPYEITGYLQIVCNIQISESACTARIRDLRKTKFGGYTVKSRPRQGCTAWEYMVISKAEQAKAA